MQLTNISISAINFDNRPFVRSLTATIMNQVGSQTVKASGSNLVAWNFPVQNTYALMPNGSAYPSSFVAPVSAIGTLYFYFSATPYDYTTSVFTLCTLNIRARNIARDFTALYSLQYDTFPNIDLNLFINFENTSRHPLFYIPKTPDIFISNRDSSTIFYRPVSANSYSANVLLDSTTYNLITALSSSVHQTWFTLNNSTTRVNLSSNQYSFTRTVPVLSTVQAFLSARGGPNSLSAWYDAHTIKKELSVSFIPNFPVASFVAYPSAFFLDAARYDYLTDSTFITLTPGVCFYGEGHTENILLSSANTGNYNYIWRINNSINEYPITITSQNRAHTTISTEQRFYPILPISLIVTDSYILSSGPVYYFDDNTGTPTYYSFFTTTLDLSNNEALTNTKFKQSIRVAPYAADYFIAFNPGLQPTVYLPLNGSKKEFIASFDAYLNNPEALSACFDKHQTIWKWSTFLDCSAVNTAVYEPSSWGTVQCSGVFPKRWVREGLDDVEQAVPIFCTLSSIVWTLSARTPIKEWIDLPTIIDSREFTYTLQLSEYGGELDITTTGFTVSKYSDTFITLNAKQTAFCTITAQPIISNPNIVVNDWTVKPTVLEKTFIVTSVQPYELKIYTPNRYVLLNTSVFVENLFERAVPGVTALDILLDDVQGETVTVTGDNVGKSFAISYSSVGGKTVSFTGYSQFYSDTYTVTYDNLHRVLEVYDIINPEAYISLDRVITDLPWKEQPVVGANDWVVSDNINSCIKKFYENLMYLDKRNFIYQDTFNEYFGWLGPEPTVLQGVTSCPVFTWDDTDCTNPENIFAASWMDLMSGGVIPEVTETGSYARCGTWQTHICPISSVVPNCLGKYCLEWRWTSRKSTNSTALVTWKDTQCAKSEGKFGKVWLQPLQECETVKNINCDEGVWNVNIPGLNDFYDPIPECYSQNRCTYTSIASFNNILYLTQNTQIKLLSSNRTATFFDLRTTYNDATPFVNIKSIALDSQQRIYVLDGTLSQVSVYEYKQNSPGERWVLFTTFGGIGGSTSKTKFFNPTELHVDQFDNIWVVDTGNFVLKQFTYTGSWQFTLRDDEYFREHPPRSVCVDSQSNVHVLTDKSVRVYTYRGVFLFEYVPGPLNKPLIGAHKINTNYNREIVYIASKSQVIRHFRNGNYSGTIIDNKQCVDNIQDVFHDEYRNLLVVNDDKVLKFVDTMTIIPLKGKLPQQFWQLNELLIHDEEYVQNWVYTKALHRLWDNIEIFKNTLIYDDSGPCKQYRPPLHIKDKITVGQNEIVTSTVINRSLKYLWDNFNVLMEYYKTNC